MTDAAAGFERLDRYVAGLEDLAATLRRRNRRLWQAIGVICVVVLIGTAASVVGWRSASRSSRDNHQLLELVLPVLSPEAKAQQAAAAAYYAGYLDALCVGQNRLAAVLQSPSFCVAPSRPPPS